MKRFGICFECNVVSVRMCHGQTCVSQPVVDTDGGGSTSSAGLAAPWCRVGLRPSGLRCNVLQRLPSAAQQAGALGHQQRELLQGLLSGMLSGSSLFQQG